MEIQDWSDDIIMVDLPPEPGMVDEVKKVIEMVRNRNDCHVVMDFSDVDIITAATLTGLLKLRKLVMDSGHRLIFCSTCPATKGMFLLTGLDGIFETVEDKFVALTNLETAG